MSVSMDSLHLSVCPNISAANWYVYYPSYTNPPTRYPVRSSGPWQISRRGGGPGVAGWSGGPTTPEPALGAHDRLNTTDVPEEIEARPDKSISSKIKNNIKLMSKDVHVILKKTRTGKKTHVKTIPEILNLLMHFGELYHTNTFCYQLYCLI